MAAILKRGFQISQLLHMKLYNTLEERGGQQFYQKGQNIVFEGQNGELYTWFDKLEFCYLFFPFIEKSNTKHQIVMRESNVSLSLLS